MGYRNGTYIAFHANNTTDPCESDIKYYNLIKAWTAKKDDEFTFVNSHDKTNAVRDSSKKETLRNRLAERLRDHSKNMLLILSAETKNDKDWVPFEISYAVDKCDIPIIIAYPGFEVIRAPMNLSNLWPSSLTERILNGKASCIHISFKKETIKNAIDQFDFNNKPKGGGLGIYSDEAYRNFGIIQ